MFIYGGLKECTGGTKQRIDGTQAVKYSDIKEFADDSILNAYKCVEVTFKDGSNILLKQIDEDYLDVVRNNIDDKLVMLHDTGCVGSYCINDDDYIWIQNLMLKVVEDNGGIEDKFRSMNY